MMCGIYRAGIQGHSEMTKDLYLAVAEALVRSDVGKQLRKRAREHEMTAQEVIAQAEARVTERLRRCAHKHGLTDREADTLGEVWKRAVIKTNYWKLPLRAQEPPSIGNSAPARGVSGGA
jgi:hypothetical protein